MFKELANLGNLLKQAQQMGGRMEGMAESLRAERLVGSAGDGAVEVEANGLGEILRLSISPQLIARQDQAALEQLIPAAVNQVIRQARELHAKSLKDLTGGLGLPGVDQILAKFTDPSG